MWVVQVESRGYYHDGDWCEPRGFIDTLWNSVMAARLGRRTTFSLVELIPVCEPGEGVPTLNRQSRQALKGALESFIDGGTNQTVRDRTGSTDLEDQQRTRAKTCVAGYRYSSFLAHTPSFICLA